MLRASSRLVMLIHQNFLAVEKPNYYGSQGDTIIL